VNRQPKIVEAPGRDALLISPADIEDEGTIVRKLLANQGSELGKPLDVFVLLGVPVFLFALQSERRGGDDEVDAVVVQRAKKVQGVAD